MRPLSYTQIELYRQCPLSYKLQYIEGLKPKDKWQFSFGSTLHKAAEYFFRVKLPQPPSLESLLAYYEKNWLSEGYASHEEEAGYRKYGKEILTGFWKAHYPGFRMPLAVEYPFNINFEGVKLRGYIDRVDKLDSGKLAVVDYKSSYHMFTAAELEENLQLTFYQLAAEHIWKLPVEKLTLYHLRSNTSCSCEARSSAGLEEARDIVLDTAECIARERFEPQENQYCPCDFPEYCPLYRHKYAPSQETEAKAGLEVPIKDIVESYVLTQLRIKELEVELKEMRDCILGFCDSQKISRVFGDKHSITYRLIQRMGFNEDEVKALLEPEGLWQKVISFDDKKLKELMETEELAVNLLKKLEKMKLVNKSYPQLFVKRLSGEEE